MESPCIVYVHVFSINVLSIFDVRMDVLNDDEIEKLNWSFVGRWSVAVAIATVR